MEENKKWFMRLRKGEEEKTQFPVLVSLKTDEEKRIPGTKIDYKKNN